MSDTESTATPARPGRITEHESFLDLIDQLAYGDLATWQRLYRTAMADPRMRDTIVRAAPHVDPDFAAAGQVWQTLVSRMPTVAATPAWAAHAATATSDAGAASVRAATRLVPPTTSPPASAR
jgi:hypothetical protein